MTVIDILDPSLFFRGAVATNGIYDSISGKWSLTALAPGDADSLVIFAEVGPGTAGTVIENAAEILDRSEADSNPANDRDFVSTLIVDPVDLSVSKDVMAPSYAVGDTVVYEIAIDNTSPNTATTVNLEDALPLELTFRSATADRGAYDPGTGRWTVGAIFPLDKATLQIKATVNDGEEGTTVVNAARAVSVDQLDANPSNDVDVAVCSIEAPGVGISDLGLDVTLVTPEPIREGDSFTVQLGLSNAGPDDATNVRLQNVVPAGTVFVSDSSPGYDPGTGVWMLGTVPGGGDVVLELTFQVSPGTGGDVVVDLASVRDLDQTDPNPANDADFISFTVEAVTDFAITQSVDDPAPAVGDTVHYVIGIENLGATDGTDVVVRDLLPGSLELLSAVGTGFYEPSSGFWFIGNVDAGAQDSLVVDARIRAGSEGAFVANTASFFNADQPDTERGERLGERAADRAHDRGLRPRRVVRHHERQRGGSIVFGVHVANDASIDASVVRVHVDLPPDVSLDAATPDVGTFDDGSGFWDIPVLAAGTGGSLELSGAILPAAEGTVMTFTSHVESAGEEIIRPDNDADTLMVSVGFVPDVAVSKSANRTSALEGDEIVYTIRSTNAGGRDLTGIAITDPFPPDLRYVGHTLSQGAFDPVSGTWVVGSQAVAETDSVVVTMAVNPGAKGTTILNTASLAAVNEGDAVPTNDVASAAVLVDETVDIAVEKTASAAEATVGELITYRIVAENLGSVDATGVADHRSSPRRPPDPRRLDFGRKPRRRERRVGVAHAGGGRVGHVVDRRDPGGGNGRHDHREHGVGDVRERGRPRSVERFRFRAPRRAGDAGPRRGHRGEHLHARRG